MGMNSAEIGWRRKGPMGPERSDDPLERLLLEIEFPCVGRAQVGPKRKGIVEHPVESQPGGEHYPVTHDNEAVAGADVGLQQIEAGGYVLMTLPAFDGVASHVAGDGLSEVVGRGVPGFADLAELVPNARRAGRKGGLSSLESLAL